MFLHRMSPVMHTQLSSRPNLSRSHLLALDGIRLWHLFRGFPSLLTTLTYQPLPPQYTIGEFVTAPNLPSDILAGEVLYREEKLWIVCRKGLICIFPAYPFQRMEWEFTIYPMIED